MGNLASAVDELFAVDPRDVPAPHRQEQIEEILRQRNRLDAAYLRLLEAEDRSGAAAGRSRYHDGIYLFGHAIVKKPNGRYTVDVRPGSAPDRRGPRSRPGP